MSTKWGFAAIVAVMSLVALICGWLFLAIQ